MTIKNTLSLIIIGAFSLLVSGCVTQKKYDSALNRIDQLDRQRHSLQRTNANLRAMEDQEMVEFNEYLAKNYFEASERLDTLSKHLGVTLKRLDLAKSSLQELSDSLESAFELFLPEEIQLIRDRGQIKIVFHDRIFFETGKAEVSDHGKKALKTLAFVINNQDQQMMVNVIGNADDRKIVNGKLRDNWELSVKRGVAVVRILEDAGVPSTILTASGRSHYDPLRTNETDLGRAMNRRTEIVLVPIMTEAIYNLLIGQN